jgi:2-polyprenyl-3-methyl-5-hydroxy-6-metoxy-1,4-benzoquinol methylase
VVVNGYSILTHCVACGGEDLTNTLDLGEQPLANDFLEPGSVLPLFPLALMLCMRCFHSQLSVAVNPERLFSKYSYVSGTSNTLSAYFDTLSARIITQFGAEGKLLDIGSNDGSFLQKFSGSDWQTIGIDPAINLIPESAGRGVVTIPTFFDESISKLLASDFDVVVAMNVFAHTKDPLEILRGISNCLSRDGRAFIQTSQANMFFSAEFDTVYHEHISFFNIRSMKALLARADLSLVKVVIVPIHGMSYLWEIRKGYTHTRKLPREIEEENFGLYDLNLYSDFAKLARDKADYVVRAVKDFRDRNFKIVSYGAAAKGNTFINFAEISFDYIFDDTPQKIGRLSPAGGCIVSAPVKLKDIDSPLLIIIPAWNFGAEILEKIRLLRDNVDDVYLTYFPETELKNVF